VLDLQGDPVHALDPGAVTGRTARRRAGTEPAGPGGRGPAPAVTAPGALLAGALFAGALLAGALFAGACSAPRPTAAAAVPVTAPAPAMPLIVQPAVRLDTAPTAPAAPADDLLPDILRPASGSADAEVARIGERTVWKRHVYDRLLETNPQQARDLVDNLVLDLLVADLAETYGVRVTAAEIDAKLAEEETQMRERLAAEWKGELDFDRYLVQQFGMDHAEYRRWRRLTLARTLYRQYVIRYHAMRSERVQVRYIVSSDRAVLEDARKQIKDGASFARLALRHSEDESRKDGGLLPPFGPGLQHPVADMALGLEPGDLSEVLEREVDGQRRYYLVSCLRRIPADVRPFAEVRSEIDEDIKGRPLSRFDFHAFYFATRAASESPRNGAQGR
jgi:parvulin-like peptidyl-prolyl isomerase